LVASSPDTLTEVIDGVRPATAPRIADARRVDVAARS
jgi:hypothetical protein